MKNDEFKTIHIKNRMCYYFSDIIDNILMDEKSHQKIFVYDIKSKLILIIL